MGLRGGYTGEVDDLVQAEWERNGVSDAAGYRKVAEYQWRNMAGGTVDTLRNSANDLSYRLQEGRAEQLAENDAVRDAANGKGNYEDLYRYYLAKYQEETKDFEPVKAVDWGEAYNAETARMGGRGRLQRLCAQRRATLPCRRGHGPGSSRCSRGQYCRSGFCGWWRLRIGARGGRSGKGTFRLIDVFLRLRQRV